MKHFSNIESDLHVERVNVAWLAEQIRTPFYVYSASTIEHNYDQYYQSKDKLDLLICFAVKANSNLAVLNLIALKGGGADCVSSGEIKRAILAGIDPQKIVYSGVGKTDEELTYALKSNILQFNVESEAELYKLNEIAASLGLKASFAIRINPDIDARTIDKITTGKKENKFGIDIKDARALYNQAFDLRNVRACAISMHIGSQILSLEPFVTACDKMLELLADLRSDGHNITHLDLGGGLGVNYHLDDNPPSKMQYLQMLNQKFANSNCKIIIEPGRSIVADAGLLVSKVIYIKNNKTKNFLIIDAAMNDFMRPAFYEAYHKITSVKQMVDSDIINYDVVGPVCESSDYFAKDRQLPEMKANDLIAVHDAGAYGAVMSSSYNTRPLIAEIMVKDNKFHVIRAQFSIDEIIAQDKIPSWN